LSYLNENNKSADSKNLATSFNITFRGIETTLPDNDYGQAQLKLFVNSLKENKPVKVYGTLGFYLYSKTIDGLAKNLEENALFFNLDSVEPIEEK
jgi:hypothetical protein